MMHLPCQICLESSTNSVGSAASPLPSGHCPFVPAAPAISSKSHTVGEAIWFAGSPINAASIYNARQGTRLANKLR